MPGPLKLSNLWRIVRDVDLSAPRDAARSEFRIVIVSETGDDARRLRGVLTGSDALPHPWLHATSAQPESLTVTPSAPLAGVLVTREATLSEPMTVARQRFTASGTPVLVVVVGDRTPAAGLARPGEHARVLLPALDEGAVEPMSLALADIAGDDRQLALASQLPIVRPPIVSRIIERTARANASFAFTTGLAESVPVLSAPLNLGDIVVLTKNQVMMCYRIALASGRDGEPRQLLGEILGVLGGGLLFRQAARELVGLIPFVGIPAKVAVAYTGTYAIGRAISAWLSDGRRITSETIARYSRESLDKGRAFAQRLSAATTPARQSRLERLRHFLPPPRRRA
jgi:uncharacterized protein (DUF697 family)